MPEVSIELKGLDKLRAAFRKFPSMVAQHMTQAGSEAAKEILKTKGLKSYPAHTAANQPPTPYYIRGRGTQYKSFNAGNSEKYGARWTVKSAGYRTTIGNTASYAPYLAGERQARAMKKIGWIKLTTAVDKKIVKIRSIYQAWVNKALRRAGL